MSVVRDAITYIEALANCDPGVADGRPRGVPVNDFEQHAAEAFGHSPRQVRTRLKPIRDAGLVLRLPARSGRPASLRLTSIGIQARECQRGGPR